ncbi:MAG: YceI family protein [Rickettsiales bacterium]|nr:YceI family protein [Rickettsiales bacterium]
MKSWIVALLFVALPGVVQAASYKTDYANSKITFSGTHAGNAFSGTFQSWQAVIQFDPVALNNSQIDITVDMASAKTGNTMYDGTLPTADWFDLKNHPQATYSSKHITRNDDGSYTAQGTLTLRAVSKPLAIQFALTPAEPAVKTTFTLTIDRLAYGIGASSDPKAEWVNKDITLNVILVAQPVL